MSEHTPGLLEAYKSGIYASSGLCVAMRHPQAGSEYPANAARLAACWNACEGINPEAVPLLLEALALIGSLLPKETDYSKGWEMGTVNLSAKDVNQIRAALVAARKE